MEADIKKLRIGDGEYGRKKTGKRRGVHGDQGEQLVTGQVVRCYGLMKDVYDIGVNKIVKGPIGYVGGMSAIAFGAIQTVKGPPILAIPALIGGAAILKADAIVSTMGLIF